MPDLHGWISQQITATEARAHACPPWPWRYEPDDDQVVAADGIQVAEVFALSGRQVHATGMFLVGQSPETVLRRCAADRRVLARHDVDPQWADSRLWATACKGCGTTGDCDDPVTENINDCPELLDLAHAYGLTEEQLASLDRPQPPERAGPSLTEAVDTLGRQLDRMLRPTTPTSAVPAALRGPNWKGRL